MSRRRIIKLTCSHSNCRGCGTYDLPVRCWNCGIEGIGRYTKTHEARTAPCPHCETNNLVVDRRAEEPPA